MSAETQPLLHGDKDKDKLMDRVPTALWANAIRSTRSAGRYLPQAIGHRGYKAKWPENTMGAFQGAVDVGAHAIETDLHLSADGVVVLSHDPNLKRCFGLDKKISDCVWEDQLSKLETLREPKQGMPRLLDLLRWLNEPANEKIWIVLDVKIDDDADELLEAVAQTIGAVPAGKKPWEKRIVVGCWNATFIQAARRLLPTYPLVNIAWYPPYSRQFLQIPNVGFNMLQQALVGPVGSRFLTDVRKAGRQLLVWTVNEERWMEWCLNKNANPPGGRKYFPHHLSSSSSSSADEIKTKRKGQDEETLPSGSTDDPDAEAEEAHHSKLYGSRLIDGVITDDPKLFLDVCARWEDEQDGLVAPRKPRPDLLQRCRAWVREGLGVARFQLLAGFYYLLMRFYYKRLDWLPRQTSVKRHS